MTFAAVVVLEKLVVYCGGVYAGGDEISSVLEGMTSEVLGASVDDSGVSDGVSDGVSEGVSEGASDEDGTSDVESAALLEGSTLEEGELEGAGVSLLEGSREELGGLPELLGIDAVTVVGSAVEVTTVGERVTIGVSTDRTVD